MSEDLAPLNQVPLGKKVCLVSIDGEKQLTRRLLSLGLALGAEVEVLHHRGRGVVVGREGNRVALGGGIAEKLMTKAVD